MTKTTRGRKIIENRTGTAASKRSAKRSASIRNRASKKKWKTRKY